MTREEDIRNAVETMRRGGVILYPTDTVWGIGCDATNVEAVKRVYAIKQRDDSKALICLVDSDARLQRYFRHVPDVAWQLVGRVTLGSGHFVTSGRNVTKCPDPNVTLLEGLGEHPYVYFVHSYYVPVCAETIATADYILPYSASMHKDNFYTCQFHPEKSGKIGERILRNFLEL